MSVDCSHSYRNTLCYLGICQTTEAIIAKGNRLRVIDIRIPKALRILNVSDNMIDDLNYITFPEEMDEIDVSRNHLHDLSSVRFPARVTKLAIGGNSLKNIANIKLPLHLSVLDLSSVWMKDGDLEGVTFPDSITQLNLELNFLREPDCKLPKSLAQLDLNYNGLERLDGFQFPEGLKQLNIEGNWILHLDGVYFPETLVLVEADGNRLMCLDSLYMSPGTTFECDYKPSLRVSGAIGRAWTSALLRRIPFSPFAPGAWWVRISYVLGGVVFQEYDSALYKK